MLRWKWRNISPKVVVTSSRISSVGSECIRSLANPCQWAQVKSNSMMAPLCGSGNRPSNTGIAHWQPGVGQMAKLTEDADELTWRRSSKSLAAIFFSSEVLDLNFLMVSRPNVGIALYLEPIIRKYNTNITISSLTDGQVHATDLGWWTSKFAKGVSEEPSRLPTQTHASNQQLTSKTNWILVDGAYLRTHSKSP